MLLHTFRDLFLFMNKRGICGSRDWTWDLLHANSALPSELQSQSSLFPQRVIWFRERERKRRGDNSACPQHPWGFPPVPWYSHMVLGLELGKCAQQSWWPNPWVISMIPAFFSIFTQNDFLKRLPPFFSLSLLSLSLFPLSWVLINLVYGGAGD